MKNLVYSLSLAVLLLAPPLAAQDPTPENRRPVKERLDRNDDGKVGPREREAARKVAAKGPVDGWVAEWRSFVAKHPEAAKRVMAKADTNDDGEISPAERRAALAALIEWRHEHVQEDWDHFAEEHPEAAKKLRAEIDKNGDGKIEPAERELAHKRMLAFREECRERREDRADKPSETVRPDTPRTETKGNREVEPREREQKPEVKQRREQRRDR